MTGQPADFPAWWAALRTAALRRESVWLLGPDPDFHRPAFEAGRAPEEELQALLDLAEWRGCGCSGG